MKMGRNEQHKEMKGSKLKIEWHRAIQDHKGMENGTREKLKDEKERDA